MTAGRRAGEAGTPELAREAPDPITTDQLVAEAGVPRETLYEWVARRLLPRPQVSSTTTTWPPGALERARFVAERLATHTLEEISELVRRRWPSTSRPG
jgi:hypothetical protein